MNVTEQVFEIFKGMTIKKVTNFLLKEKCYGTPGEATNCPLAEYARKQGCRSPAIGDHEIHVTKDGVRYITQTPYSLRKFIRLFDY